MHTFKNRWVDLKGFTSVILKIIQPTLSILLITSLSVHFSGLSRTLQNSVSQGCSSLHCASSPSCSLPVRFWEISWNSGPCRSGKVQRVVGHEKYHLCWIKLRQHQCLLCPLFDCNCSPQIIMVRLQRVTFLALHNYLGLTTELFNPVKFGALSDTPLIKILRPLERLH